MLSVCVSTAMGEQLAYKLCEAHACVGQFGTPVPTLSAACQARWPQFNTNCLAQQLEPGALFFCHDYVRSCDINHQQLWQLRQESLGLTAPDQELCEFYRPDRQILCGQDGFTVKVGDACVHTL